MTSANRRGPPGNEFGSAPREGAPSEFANISRAAVMGEMEIVLTTPEQDDLGEILKGIDDPNVRDELTRVFKESLRSERWFQQQRDMSDQ